MGRAAPEPFSVILRLGGGAMFKYTIKAYSNFGEIGGINAVHVVVTAPNEEAAIGKARTIVQRENYAVLVIEDLRGGEIRKAETLKRK